RRARGDASAGEGGRAADAPLRQLRSTATTRWIVDQVSQSRIVERRRRNYATLASALRKIDGARALYAELREGVTPYVFPLYVEEPAAAYQKLRSVGAPLFRWDELWPGTPVLKGDTGRDWADRVFQLACHQELSPADMEAVAAAVRSSIGS